MIHFIENIDPNSNIAYFVKPAQPPENQPDPAAVLRAAEVIDNLRAVYAVDLTDADLVLSVLKDGVVRREYQHLLIRHLGAPDPPVDSLWEVMWGAEKRGEMGPAELEAVKVVTAADWRKYEVIDSKGRLGEVDETGVAIPTIYSDPEDFVAGAIGPLVAEELDIVQEDEVNGLLWQVDLKWVDGQPTLRHYNFPDWQVHKTLGRVATDGSFTPVLTILSSDHPARKP